MPPIQIERMEWHFSGLAAKEMAQTAPNRAASTIRIRIWLFCRIGGKET